jgi:hypothetical protein
MSDLMDLIVDAVRLKKQVICDYQGYKREFCIHVVGWKHGKEQALAYQYEGGSSKGLPSGGAWRCVRLDELANVTTREGQWHTSHDHSKPQTCVDDVVAEVAY